MKPPFRAATPDQLGAVQMALSRADLPHADLTPAHLADFLIATDDDGGVTCCAGIQAFGRVGLLRSLMVATPLRAQRLGASLLRAIEDHAQAGGVRSLFLLTTTAAPFFTKWGYATVQRADAPVALQGTAEFASICPASATCMHRHPFTIRTTT